MSRLWAALRRAPLYPFLFAAFPVVFLWAENRDSGTGLGPVVLVLSWMVLGALAVFLVLRLILRNTHRAALMTTLVVLLFATFGHIELALKTGAGSPEENFLLLAWALLGVSIGFVIVRVDRPERAAGPMNAIAAVLVGLNLLPIAPALAFSGSEATARWTVDTRGWNVHAAGPQRDIYYLIFDRYAGPRTLHDLYGFDDSALFTDLKDRGFVTFPDALANYPQTTHSLASSLNMTYLDGLAKTVGPDTSWDPLFGSLSAPTVATTLQHLGYRYEHVGSWWTVTWNDPAADDNFVYGGAPEFASVFLSTTIFPTLQDRFGLLKAIDLRRERYDRIAYQMQSLQQISRDPRPTFTFAHVLLPHPPYVFHADGSFVGLATNGPWRRRTSTSCGTRTRSSSVSSRRCKTPRDRITIVVQSDEGPHPPSLDTGENINYAWGTAPDSELGRKLRILQAYYLPGISDPGTYPTITPVNTFRLIFDDYFGARLPLLPDRTFVFTDRAHPYRFMDVTDRLRN